MLFDFFSIDNVRNISTMNASYVSPFLNPWRYEFILWTVDVEGSYKTMSDSQVVFKIYDEYAI